MPMPRADQPTAELFRSLLPDDPRVTVRPMFGNLAAFVNGTMFSGVFGDRIFVRLSERTREELLGIAGAEEFSPMEGRPMREYATLPHAWHGDPAEAQEWILRSLEWTASLPPKPKKRR